METMLDPIIVGNVIQNCRQKKGVSQEVLSGLAGIGRTHLSAIERGERKPTLETFYRIAVALGIKSSELFSAIESEINACNINSHSESYT
jgi:transcriptional regulator with XRE-family HTH domain